MKPKESHPYKWVMNPDYDGHRYRSISPVLYTSEAVYGQIRYGPGGYVGPRTQKDYELVWIHSGCCTVRINENSKELMPGQVYLFFPGQREHFNFSPTLDTLHSWCAVSPSFMPKKLKRKLNHSHSNSELSKTFNAICTGLMALGPIRSDHCRACFNALAIALFEEFHRLANDERHDSGKDLNARKAAMYMEEHYPDENCAAQALKAAGCSRNALIYKFKREFGVPPSNFLWELRAEKGLAKLLQTGLTISQISDQCGFKNPFHFSRTIKKIQGCSPRKLRMSAWK